MGRAQKVNLGQVQLEKFKALSLLFNSRADIRGGIMPVNSNSASLGLIQCVFLSVNHRDTTLYPSASDFTVDLPNVISKVNGVAVRHFKYTPEALINNNNKDFTFTTTDANGQNTVAVSLTKGDYNQDITVLLAEIKTAIDAKFGATSDFVTLVVNADDRVEISFTSSTFTNLSIASSSLLTLLGFTGGISIANGVTTTATNKYRIINDTDLILRITDIESIISVDAACNRATAILLSSRSPKSVVEQVQYTYAPLLQVQHRVQRLRVKILNIYGEPYDLYDDEACFSIDFYCNGNDGK